MDAQLTNLQLFSDIIMSVWTKISEKCFQHLVQSIILRIVAGLKVKVGLKLIIARCSY